MATDPVKGPLGLICIGALVCLAIVVFAFIQSPELAHLVDAAAWRRDPDQFGPKLFLGLGAGVAAMVVAWLLGFRR